LWALSSFLMRQGADDVAPPRISAGASASPRQSVVASQSKPGGIVHQCHCVATATAHGAQRLRKRWRARTGTAALAYSICQHTIAATAGGSSAGLCTTVEEVLCCSCCRSRWSSVRLPAKQRQASATSIRRSSAAGHATAGGRMQWYQTQRAMEC